MSLWDGVLDTQLDVADWLASDKGLRFGAGFFASAYANPDTQVPKDTADPLLNAFRDEDHATRAGRQWSHRLSAATFNAEPISVDRDMMTVCEAAVAGFRPEPLATTDLLTQNGMLLLPRSLSVVDPSGNRLSWRLAVWFPYQRLDANGKVTDTGLHLVLFHDVKDPDDIDNKPGGFFEYLKKTGQKWTCDFIPTHVVDWPWGTDLASRAEGHSVISTGYAAEPDRPIIGIGEDGEEVHSLVKRSPGETGRDVHQQIQGIWRLLMQHIAVRSSVQPARQERKRVARLPSYNITFVRLRRPESERGDTEPTTVHWSHRWLVGGHWRNQWYPSLGLHRQVWISPYVKGPDDLPLVASKGRVFRLDR